MGTEVKKCKEWLEEKYGLNICDRFGIIEKVIEYCKEHKVSTTHHLSSGFAITN